MGREANLPAPSRMVSSAPSAMRAGMLSPHGDALPMLPPTVATLRICTDPTWEAASARHAACCHTRGSACSCVKVVIAPMRRRPASARAPASSFTPDRSTMRSGRRWPRRMALTRSVPPARSSTRRRGAPQGDHQLRHAHRGEHLTRRHCVLSRAELLAGARHFRLRHLPCCFAHRVHDRGVPRAAAQVAGQGLADLLLARPRGDHEQRLGRHEHARRAVAALHGPVLYERPLQHVEFAAVSQPFHGEHLLATHLQGKQQAGVDGLAVDDHRAGPALAFGAPFLGAGQTRSRS